METPTGPACVAMTLGALRALVERHRVKQLDSTSPTNGAIEERTHRYERLVAGLEALESLGLAPATLDEFGVDAQRADCSKTCRFKVDRDDQSEPQPESSEHQRHLLAASYLAGWVASSTGVDLICEPLRYELGLEVNGEEGARPPRCCEADPLVRQERAISRGDLRDLGIELEDLVEMTLDAVVFLDGSSTVRYWNRGATLMFGYESSEVLGKHVAFLFPPDLLQSGELRQLRAACAKDDVIFSYVTRRLRKDGETIWVSLTRTVSRDACGNELGVVATLRDITVLRDRDQELERSRALALVGELAAKIAHEVKNPLAGIYAALQVLEGRLEASDPQREIFDSIGEEVMRLNDITMDLLGFARPPEPQMLKLELIDFLDDLVGDLERISMISPGDVDLTGVEAGLRVNIDVKLMAQVFKNLILNGLQAGGASGVVRLSTCQHADYIAIDVADTGPGIPKESRGSIFEPFFTTKSRGTGLGLSIAKKNVEALGGSIRLRNHSGRGAWFRIELPTNY